MVKTLIPFLQSALFRYSLLYTPPFSTSYLQALNTCLLQTLTVLLISLEDISAHNWEQLAHASDISAMGRKAEQLAVVNNSSQLVDLPVRISDHSEDRAHTPNLLLTYVSSLYSNISIILSLDSWDHCVFKCLINFTCHHPLTFQRHFGANVQLTGTIFATSWLLFRVERFLFHFERLRIYLQFCRHRSLR